MNIHIFFEIEVIERACKFFFMALIQYIFQQQ